MQFFLVTGLLMVCSPRCVVCIGNEEGWVRVGVALGFMLGLGMVLGMVGDRVVRACQVLLFLMA